MRIIISITNISLMSLNGNHMQELVDIIKILLGKFINLIK